MLDFSHLPGQYGSADVQMIVGSAVASGNMYQTWQKPRGKSMCNIVLVGRGGNGGTGVIGANSVSAGGGGGGSGAQTSITLPLWAIPDVLYLVLAGQSVGAAFSSSYISTQARLAAGTGTPVANDTLVVAGNGGNGGNGAAGTAGGGGSGGGIGTAAAMPLGWAWLDAVIAGQAGIAGGAAVTAATLTLPATGLWVTGGTGGGG